MTLIQPDLFGGDGKTAESELLPETPEKPEATQEYSIRPYQRLAKDNTFSCWEEAQSTLVVMATGLGKAQPLDANVLRPDGWTKIRDVSPGDMVVGSDGAAHAVLECFDRGTLPVFRVTMSDGTSTRCCAEHLWSVQTKSQKFRGAAFSTMSTAEIARDLRDGSGASKWFLPLVCPVQFESRPKAIHPYVLGVLLGDGSLSGGSVSWTKPDEFIADTVSKLVPDGMSVVRHENKDRCVSWSITGMIDGRNPVKKELDELGLSGKLSHEKSVPYWYKYASVEDRVNLLRGLMDTDGDVHSRDGHVGFSTSSDCLAADVCDIVRSLGGCTRIRTKLTTKYTYRGQEKFGRTCYRVTVSLNGINPFALPRKADLVFHNKNQGQTKAIVAIKSDGEAECRCIKVAAADGLYVTDDYILTHNTA